MWMQISSGKGPAECELAAGLFLKTILKEHKNANIIDSVPGQYAGTYKSVLLDIDSAEFNNNIKKNIGKHTGNSQGTILWICQSPYRPNHRRKNWFIDTEVYPEAELLSFAEKDVRFETRKSSGPGGQNVNKVETAVRALHLPTGLTVTATEERSQYMNKKLALFRLANLIEAENEETGSSRKEALWKQHNQLIRGNPLRVYEGADFKLVQTR